MNYYTTLNKQTYNLGEYSIVPIRDEDKWNIMKWRNEQIYHLRQAKPLTEQDQERYFADVVSTLFVQERPSQLLFSYLYKNECIGYGGLVHINWVDKNAEISFIMDTQLETGQFHHHWSVFLFLIEKIAFKELAFHKIFTYAFDIRPHLYEVLERSNYIREAELHEHCCFDGGFKSVIIHSKVKPSLIVRTVDVSDKNLIFEWANEEQTRKNSFNSEPIIFENHSVWFDKKLQAGNALYFVCEYMGTEAALLRFDVEEEYATIGIIIAKDFRGQGLALSCIRECCRMFRFYSDKPIHAYIKPENIASKKSFEKAGFTYKGNRHINNIEALVYENDK